MRCPTPELDLVTTRDSVREAVRLHGDLVYRVAYRVVRNAADAEDVAQAVFLRLLHEPEGYTRAASPKAWLARTALNRAADWIRSERRRAERERAWAALNQPRGKGDTDMRQERIQEAVDSLPDALRLPVVLHYQEGLKYREIAEVLECPPGTVAKRIALAKERLRARLKPVGSLVLYPSIESALAAEAPVAVPPRLAERLLGSLDRELQALARAGGPEGFHPARPAPRFRPGGGAANLGLAFLLAVAVAPAGWLAIRHAASSGSRARDAGRAPAAVAAAQAPAPTPASTPAGPASRVAAGEARDAREASPAPPGGGDGEPEAAGGEAEADRGPALAGWVHDRRGRPLPGVEVTLEAGGGCSSCHAGHASSAKTDGNGYYELAAPPMKARSSGDALDLFIANKIEFEQAGLKARQSELALEAARTWIVAGDQLAEVEASQAAVLLAENLRANAEVSYQRAWQAQVEVQLKEQAALYESQVRSLTTPVAKFDATMLGLTGTTAQTCAGSHQPPASVRATARLEGFVPGASGELQLEAAAPARHDFVLEMAAPLAGTVLDESGRPLAGAEVTAVAFAGRAPAASVTAPVVPPTAPGSVRSDDGGHFAFLSLPPGFYLLKASAEGHGSREVVAAPGGPGATFQLPATGSARIEVARAESGEPLAGYTVELRDDGDGLAAQATTGDDGVAALAAVLPGRYRINVFHEQSSSRQSRGRAEVTVAARAESPARVEVASKVPVEGVVLGTDGEFTDLQAVAAPWAGSAGTRGSLKAAAVAADGTFTFPGLAPGRYLVAVVRGAPGKGGEVLAAVERQVLPGETLARVSIRVAEAEVATFRIAVEGAGGESLPGATARLGWPDCDLDVPARTGEKALEVRAPTGAPDFEVVAAAPGYRERRLGRGELEAQGTTRIVLEPERAPGSEPEEPLLPAGISSAVWAPATIGGLLELAGTAGGWSVEPAPGVDLDYQTDGKTGDLEAALAQAAGACGLRCVPRGARLEVVRLK